MKFKEFSSYLQRLEETAKRLEISTILKELLSKLGKEEVKEATYLSLGYLKAPFESLKFNIADKMMLRILSLAYLHKSPAEIATSYGFMGDLGDVAFKLAEKSSSKKNPSVKEVYEALTIIAKEEGFGSQDSKIQLGAVLLRDLDGLSAKYVVRIILGTTRLGFTELTMIQALSELLGNKKLAKQIEAKYNIYPDIGAISELVTSRGLQGLNEIEITTGIPVLSQKAQRVSGIDEAAERIKASWSEYKFDGTRVQLHLDRKKHTNSTKDGQNDLFNSSDKEIMVETFTRNLEPTTHQFPDIVRAAKEQLVAESVILDGEAIGYDSKTGTFLPFQETIQRKRKHDVEESSLNIPLKYMVFDILYLNGESLLEKPLEYRHHQLERVVKHKGMIEIAEHFLADNSVELKKQFDQAKKHKLEGIIAKDPKGPYSAGARSYSWIKLKAADEKLLDDSIDCVVLGYYFGKGTRSKLGIGGFLVGIYDEASDGFKTLTKVGTGLTEEDFEKLKRLADTVKTNQVPANVEMDKAYMPDVITLPKIVVEIGADEISKSPSHSAGYALRFPRLLKFREDKGVNQITTLKEIELMFKNK
ncbi:hypothetical protein A3K34_00285 [candidate division WWE3 bacterium RIFOXYC1_FULL_40_10]|uniref:DNA ligase n=1 Tax=candidate division WWE3 bacterium RIFOXYA2_FULL_46_9 TaxID=1802636 RepID=A0A1F4W1K3_UNCKA|nr:MAG: hypothetical protein A3K58_00285 [candidate division WWE3 bacterium RIFOXYB1_FULL_40_22]OGC61330.1 MAG: hypothetical protein A3K37_00285 [candidate division WWE3 bacterium RIFOXYA1_FULL_40_11]OGC63240.1 MAG: hypothetical protein A2264_00940 [candidate division WWE3 bacterium RIFOXYA2_FULL_46_9]OGC65320.1 MAG: hypothetical protein A2326_04570 [candidate division WWE3 bacterium RIFOXYB2_FULL_41_6]OGC65713.1 MAG: hypothetical protein A3K34_00285 [candidate division WWE3 bacterium RIFOXYC1_